MAGIVVHRYCGSAVVIVVVLAGLGVNFAAHNRLEEITFNA